MKMTDRELLAVSQTAEDHLHETTNWDVQANALMIQSWMGLAQQGGPGIADPRDHPLTNSNCFCVYYCATTRNRCAVGHLLRPEEYHLGMERQRVGDLATVGLLPKRLMSHVHLLVDMQLVHDDLAGISVDGTAVMGFDFIEELAKRYLVVADHYGERLAVARRKIESDLADRRSRISPRWISPR